MSRFVPNTHTVCALRPMQANTTNQATAAELYDFMKRVRSGARVSNDDIKRFAKLFNDEITLDSVDRCVCA